MEHSELPSEETASEPFEYVMPLTASSPSPVKALRSDGDIGPDRNWDADDHRNDESHQENIPYVNRRGSNQTDATPRFQNTTRGSRFEVPHDRSAGGLPPVPFQNERSQKSLGKEQTSLSSFIAKNNGSIVSFNLVPKGDGSLSSFSQSYPGNNSIPLTPSSIAPSTFSRKTADRSKRSLHQISMSGAIQEIPLSPAESRASASSAFNSQRSPKSALGVSRQESDTPLGSGNASFHSNASGTEIIPESERYPIGRRQDMDGGFTDDEYDMVDPIVFWNIALPMWLSILLRSPPSLNRISHFVVHVLPCFWCCGSTAQSSSTDRSVLTRLNVLCLFMAFIQLWASLWLATLLLIVDDEPGAFAGFAPHFWNLNGASFSVGILGFILIVTCSCTIRAIKEVDLVGAIRYLWVVLWLVPFEIFFNISLYDYFNVTQVWIHHWWLEPHMSFFRQYFCGDGTADNKCLVPIQGGVDYDSSEAWCMANYDASDCQTIRDDAQTNMEAIMLTFYAGLAGWGSVMLFLMLLMVNSLERIITKPIVQKSRETNVPAYLVLPTLTNALVGSILLFSPSSLLSSSSGAESSWIGIVYLVASALFLVALITGWFLSAHTIQNHGDKQTKNIAVVILITAMAANTLLLATIFIASILSSASFINSPLDENQRGEVACVVDRDSTCTQCNATIASNRCPEWTLDETTIILQTQLKQSATLASIFILYAFSVLRFGVTLRRHLSLYQIDYV